MAYKKGGFLMTRPFFWINSMFIRLCKYVLPFFGILLLTFGCSDSNGKPFWTVMVYMAGDNNLSTALLNDLNEMEVVGSTENVNVVVQIDTIAGTTRRLFVKRGGSTLLEDLGEKNMADSQTLKDFIIWTETQYPSHRYALILSSHGDGLAKRIPFHTAKNQAKILQDDTDGVSCCLSNVLVRKAIEDAGVYFDLLGFDASQMGQIETVYEFRNQAGILVLSQETGQANGWDYTAILDTLTNKPVMGGEELARVIVDSYKSFYEEIYYSQNPEFEHYLTISAVRLGSKINDLAGAVDQLSVFLINGLTGEGQTVQELLTNSITLSRKDSQELNLLVVPYAYIDLLDFIRNMQNNLEDKKDLSLIIKQIRDMIEVIFTMKNEVIISEYHGSARPHANGLSIAFYKLPEAFDYNTYDTDYKDYNQVTGEGREVQFINDTRWDEFLQTYYEKSGLL